MGIVFAGFAIGLATGLSIGVLSTLAWVDYRGEVEMKRIWTYALAMAAAKDEADRAMRREGRVKWNVDDWNLMCETFGRLYGRRVQP